MDLIDKNMAECNPRPEECKIFAAALDWDKIDHENYLEKLDYTNSESLIEGKFDELKFDYLIGSDVVYWPVSIIPLCKVLDTIFKQ